MPKNRPVRLFYALIVAIALIFIGRNLYRRYVNSALVAAIKTRNVSAVRRLLELGADPNYQVPSPAAYRLHLPPEPVLGIAFQAIRHNSADFGAASPDIHAANADEIVSLLIRKGARVRDGSYLAMACQMGDVAATRILLDHGADPNAPRNSNALRAALDYYISASRAPRAPAEQANLAENIAVHLETTRQLVHLLQKHGAHLSLMQAQVIEDTETVNKMLDGAMPGASLDGYFVMAEAAHDGDLKTLRQLLRQGIDPDQPPQGGLFQPTIPLTVYDTPLHAAISQNRVEAVTLLLEHGANPNPTRQYEEAPLAAAVSTGDLELVKLLLAHEANPNPPSSAAPLAAAVRRGNSAMVQLLLAHGANPKTNPNGAVPLVEAVWTGNLDLVNLLLEYGANSDPVSLNTSLDAAAGAGNLDIMQLLLARGAKLNRDGASPALEAAIRSRHAAVVRYFLDRGASTATLPNHQPLLTLALQKLPGVTPDLLKRGAPVNLPSMQELRSGTPSNAGPVQTVLIQTALQRLSGVIGHRVPIQEREVYKVGPDSPLLAAVWYAPQFVSTLVRAGAKIGADRSFICVVAARRKRLDLLPALLTYGADINGKDAGDTALTVCVVSAPEGIKTLLEHGADPNVLSHDRRTPLQEAAMSGNIAAARLLLAHGADVNAHVERGHTALFWARKKNHTDIVSLLQQAGARE